MNEHPDDHPDDHPPAAGPGPAPTTLRTPAQGLVHGAVSIASGPDRIPAYFARPDGPTDRPIVLVLSEAFGLHEHIRDIARRFAHLGYFAVAPDLMVRQGDPAGFTDVGALVQELLLKIPDAQVLADLDASLAWAVSQGGRPDQVVATGFCWGGRWTWLFAAQRRLQAAVAWYGFVDGAASGVFPIDAARFPAHPIDLARTLQTPVLGLHGGHDEAIAVATVHRMEAELALGGEPARASSLVVYPTAQHAFFADYRDTYDPVAAPDGWRRCLAWFDQHLGR